MNIYKNLSLNDLPNEEWRDVIGDEKRKKVSNLGRVKSKERTVPTWNGHKIIKESILAQRNRNGYLAVKNQNVHRMVAMAFIYTNNKELVVNHINGIKTDNRVTNLEWCTHKKNLTHAWDTGLYNDNTRKKISEKASLRIGNKNSCWRGYININTKDGKFVIQVETLKDAVKWIKENTDFKKADKGNISKVCNGKLSSAYSYIFYYTEDKNERTGFI